MQKAVTTIFVMLLLMAVTGLSVVVVYQHRELELLRKPELESVSDAVSGHAPSVAASGDKLDAAKQDVHQQLLKTCRNWQRWYSQDGKAVSKMNRDNACRRSSDYGVEELGLADVPIVDVSVDGRGAELEPASSSRVVRIQNRAESESEVDASASSWQQQLERLTGDN